MTSPGDLTSPRVTVLMAVCNGQAFLHEAMDSILSQTYTDFELLVIDDGSTDCTASILDTYLRRDKRVRIEVNGENIGLTRSLNRGIKSARGKYIARMDADDVALPERLSRQVAFMDANEQVGVCGSWVELVEEGTSGIVVEFPTENDSIRCQLLFGNPLAHPTVIIRKEKFVEHDLGYNERFAQSQDYDLWVRCAEHMDLANIPEPLLRLRKHDSQISSRNSCGQEISSWIIRKYQIERLGIKTSFADMKIHSIICSQQIPGSTQFVVDAECWLKKLLAANDVIKYFPDVEFKKKIRSNWLMICELSRKSGFRTWWVIYNSSLRKTCDISICKLLMLLKKYLL